MTIEQAMDVAIGHFQAGRLAEAEKLYRQILTAQPDRPDTLHALGLLLGQSGQLDTAVELIRRAVTIAPEYAAAYSNLAIALLHSGKPAEAIEALRRLIELRPDAADAHHKLGQTLLQTGQSDDAITSLRTAIALQPNVAETHFDLGNALTNKGRLDDALSAFARAVEFKPDFALAQNNLAMALNEQGRTDEAMGCFDKAVELEPDDPTYASNRIYTSMFQPGRDSKGILAAQMSWNQHYARPLRKYILPHTNDRSPERRLRIGYVSPDFRRHVIGRNMLPLLREHDREHFEIFCYSNLARPDALTQRFRSLANGWRDIAGMDDSATAQMIRDDRIDVLIDLALHMEGNRLLVFARKPAPVQGTFAGYPGGTGLDTIDFRLTDPHLDPPGQTDNDYVEQSIRLPSFWCFDPEAMTTDDTGLIETEPVGPLPAMSAGHITFGCLNNFCKVSPGTLQLWASAMRAVSGSRLLLLAPPGAARQRVLDTMAQAGIEPHRVGFSGFVPRRKEYLQLYHRIDLGLDTLPYNGHTTSLDSLWMGAPVVTLLGTTVVGRAGWSQLNNLGLPQFAATDEAQFVEIAKAWSGNLPSLAELRSTLRQRMLSSVLTDSRRFARSVETAFRQMWRGWCEGAQNL